MKKIILSGLLAHAASAQFITPDWRGNSDAEYAAWDVFTEAKFAPNSPDVHPDSPTVDATLACFTASAFLTSSGNIYSFQSATSFQIEDSANFSIQNVLLQITGLGSGIDLDSVRLVANEPEGIPKTFFPQRSFIINQEVLTGERGGQGISYAIQWNLSASPVIGTYAILFEASESSLSLDQVSLDTASSFQLVPEPKPNPPRIQQVSNGYTLTWTGNWQLESSSNLTGNWAMVSEGITTTDGEHQLLIENPTGSRFFRLTQPNATE